MADGRPADRPSGLAQSIPVGRCLDVGGYRIWVKNARCGVAELDNTGVIEIVDEGDCIKVNPDITVWVGRARSGTARLVVDAPRDIPITRPETPDIP